MSKTLIHDLSILATVLFAAAVLLIAGGLGGPSANAAGQDEGPLLVLCGTSFRLPMEALVKRYQQATGSKVEMSFGGSEELFPHVKLKDQGDIYVAHDPFIDETKKADALLRAIAVGEMVPVLVVKKGNPKGIKTIEDLARPGLRVIMPDPKYATAGQMVVELLKKKGIYDAVMKNVDNALVRSHADVGEHVRLGDRDAGLMWNGVAHSGQWAKDLEIVAAPAEYPQPIHVAIMGLSYSKRPAEVERFLKFAEKEGRKVFAEFGYVK